MYDFTKSKEFNDVVYTGLNGTNQTMRMKFQKWYYPFKHKSIWNIIFYITNKRKDVYKFREQTGTDGIKSLLWAKNCLLNFINNDLDRTEDNVIEVCWDDRKRKNVYVRSLIPLGFRLSRSVHRETLVLTINALIV